MQNIFSTTFAILATAYVQIFILILLLIPFVRDLTRRGLVVSGPRIARTIIMVLIFFFLMFVWASSVQPALRNISLVGMFVINLRMLYDWLLGRLELPYRHALAAIRTDPQKHEILHDIWGPGKRFYYLRYFGSSLFSGTNPFSFLRTMATERVKDDLKDELRGYGVEQRLISVAMMSAYLKSQLACDENLPGDFKDVILRAIDGFTSHAWIEEQGNEFLRMATESPEDLHFPEWMAKFEACVGEYRK